MTINVIEGQPTEFTDIFSIATYMAGAQRGSRIFNGVYYVLEGGQVLGIKEFELASDDTVTVRAELPNMSEGVYKLKRVLGFIDVKIFNSELHDVIVSPAGP